MWDEAGRLADWLGEAPIEAQLLKLSEEVGEVAEAYLGMTGLNPRKGVSHTRPDIVGEVADVIISAAVAIVRLAGDPRAARDAFAAHLAAVLARAGLEAVPVQTLPAQTAPDPAPPTGKLIRDNVPEFIREDGLEPVIRVAGPAEYASRLRDKLGEEVAEFLGSDDDPLELADILEVIYALGASMGRSRDELEALRAAKAESNGDFSQRLVWHGNEADGR
jgi:predicted house-cleaning noncanonical NTP pyrophosphatase (MazG superfamily)/NTP pyrophosphatase (non-canonical NTP hydrolase)